MLGEERWGDRMKEREGIRAKEYICMTHRHRQGTMEWVMDGLRAEGRASWVEVGKGGKVVTTVIM